MTWTPDQPLVSIKDVHKTFAGNIEVLKGITMDVMKREVVCIIGPSGSGKSTLLRCVNALVPIDKGSILVEGQEVNDPKLDKLALRRKVGMVFQQYNLFPHKTALENVMMAPVHVLKRDRKEVEAQALALIAKVRLQGKEQAYPGELSGGQQQRIAIARSLAMNPDVMLFDEVTAALDPETVKGVLVTIRELAEDGMTCMIVTHEMGFAREVANQIYFTDGGVLVEHGPPKEFFANPRDPRTKQFLDQISVEAYRFVARSSAGHPGSRERLRVDRIDRHLGAPNSAGSSRSRPSAPPAVAWAARQDVRAAFGAELARHRVFKVAPLEMLRRTLGVAEAVGRHQHEYVRRAAGNVLAIAAVALCLQRRIAFGDVAQRAAIASAFELHSVPSTPLPDQRAPAIGLFFM